MRRKKSIKFMLSLLRNLEGDFDNWVIPTDILFKHGFQQSVLDMLSKNELIEEKNYKLLGFPKNEKAHYMKGYRITALGINFLNGLEQKRTNNIILFLTISLIIIGVLQLIIVVIK